jgi:replicative DNA helicase
MELDIVIVFLDRKTYDRFFYLLKEEMFTREIWNILKSLEKYYKDYPTVDSVDISDFAAWFRVTTNHCVVPATATIYNKIFSQLATHICNTTNIDTVMKLFLEQDYASKIQDISMEILTKAGGKTLDDIVVLADKYSTEASKFAVEDTALVTTDVHELLRHTIGGTGYNWRIQNLNESLGPLRSGNFIVVGARPDSGKTTFLLSEATFIASQLKDKECVLWLNNEEKGEKIGRRIIEAGAGVTTEQLRTDPMGSVEKFEKEVGPLSRIKVIYQTLMHIKEVEGWCKKFKPSVIIFDQLWKVHGFEKDSANETSRQTMLFAWARGLAGVYGPVVAVHQLGGEAEGERYPPMSNLYGSQTGIQGEADAIILIGRSHDPREQDIRFFSLPKNKMGDGSKVVAGKRNAKFALKIVPEIARYEDVGSYAVV